MTFILKDCVVFPLSFERVVVFVLILTPGLISYQILSIPISVGISVAAKDSTKAIPEIRTEWKGSGK